ncbi:MAG: tetratricopeptide repeat protein [Candidatus Obscuribacter sp.]|nr:tetratricopeptide repeat protein [Candidatus Obscuribacter sp.]
MKATSSAQEGKYRRRPLRHSLALTLTLVLPLMALSPLEAKTAKSKGSRPQSVPQRKDKKHDVAWMTSYNGRSSNELLYDKRFVGLLKSIAPDVKDVVEKGSSIVDSAYDRLGGPPEAVEILKNRFLLAKADMAHFARAKAFLFYDLMEKRGILAIVDGEEWPTVFTASKQYPDQSQFPPEFNKALTDWLQHEKVIATAKVFVGPKGKTEKTEISKLEALNQIIATNPKAYELYEKRADYLVENGRGKEAIADYTKVIENCAAGDKLPLSRALAARGNLELQDNCLEEALRDFSQAIDINPCTYETSSYLARRAEVYERLNKQEEALKDLQTSIDTNKAYPGYLRRAEYYQRQGKDMEALKDLERELTKCSQYLRTRVLHTRADIHYRNKEYEKSLAACNQALKEDNNAVDLLCMRAQVYQAMNKPELAAIDRQKVKTLDPDHELPPLR